VFPVAAETQRRADSRERSPVRREQTPMNQKLVEGSLRHIDAAGCVRRDRRCKGGRGMYAQVRTDQEPVKTNSRKRKDGQVPERIDAWAIGPCPEKEVPGPDH